MRSVGTSQRKMLGRNKNKDSSNVGDDSAAALPPIVPSNIYQKQVMDVMIDKGVQIPPSSAVTPTAKTPAQHLYTEIIVPTKRRRPSRHHHPSSSAGCVAPSTTANTTIITDNVESQDKSDNVSLAFTSVSSMTGRSSLFGPIVGGISNRGGVESASNDIMPPPYQNLLSSLLWCPLGGGTNGASGGKGIGALKEAEVEDYFDYSDLHDNGPLGVLTEKGGDGDIGESDADEDGGGGMITKLLGVWNETFNSTCQYFVIGDDGAVEEGAVRSTGRQDDGSCISTSRSGVGTPIAAKTSGKSIATSGDTGGGREGETQTANDTTAIMISKKPSQHSLEKVPTFSEPLEG